MKKTNLIIFFLLALIGGLGLSIYFRAKPVTEQISADIPSTFPTEPVKNSIVHYPVPEPETTPAVVAESGDNETVPQVAAQPAKEVAKPQIDAHNFQKAFTQSIADQDSNKLLLMENFIQKFVVTIDNLPNKRLPRAHLPIIAPGGKFLVAGTAEEPQISDKNYPRYNRYVTLMESVNQTLAIKVYTYFYPLFQKAYEQLGYKSAYFNDRLVYVIDHLLTTPNPPDPILLAQPAVLFTYADPELENLSAGQKILLRLGQEQRGKVFQLLQSYREKLVNLHP